MRRAARTDSNHIEIVKHFRFCGAKVLSLAAMGKGVPDLLVCWKNITWLVEIKTPKGKQTPDQIAFLKEWTGMVVLVRSPAQVEETMWAMEFQAKLLMSN